MDLTDTRHLCPSGHMSASRVRLWQTTPRFALTAWGARRIAADTWAKCYDVHDAPLIEETARWGPFCLYRVTVWSCA